MINLLSMHFNRQDLEIIIVFYCIFFRDTLHNARSMTCIVKY